MGNKILTSRFYLIVSLIVAGAFMRLVPHWPNFTPIAAIALFGGTYIKRKELAFLIPVATLLLSDLILGFHNTMLAVYASFAMIVALGFVLRRFVSVHGVIIASLASSLLFFLVTNFAVWYSGLVPYPHTAVGLAASYTAGLPFLWNGMLGDLFYNAFLFGAYYLITNKVSVFKEA
jgi:hypothetical protein